MADYSVGLRLVCACGCSMFHSRPGYASAAWPSWRDEWFLYYSDHDCVTQAPGSPGPGRLAVAGMVLAERADLAISGLATEFSTAGHGRAPGDLANCGSSQARSRTPATRSADRRSACVCGGPGRMRAERYDRLPSESGRPGKNPTASCQYLAAEL